MESIITHIKNPALLSNSTLAELEQIIEKYPYFQSARMLYLRNLYNLCDFGQLKHHLESQAFYITQRKKLFLLLHPESTPSIPAAMIPTTENLNNPEGLNPQEQHLTQSNDDDILTLINEQAAKEIDEPAEDTTIRIDLRVNKKYFELERKESDPAPTPGELIDQFIVNDPRIKPKEQIDSNEDISLSSAQQQEDIASETLAEIYVNQKLYLKAKNMYEKLTLKYPEKSTYFASRIEELNNLINK